MEFGLLSGLLQFSAQPNFFHILALEELKGHLENPDNFVEMKFLLLEQKYLELLYKGNSIEALKVSSRNK